MPTVECVFSVKVDSVWAALLQWRTHFPVIAMHQTLKQLWFPWNCNASSLIPQVQGLCHPLKRIGDFARLACPRFPPPASIKTNQVCKICSRQTCRRRMHVIDWYYIDESLILRTASGYCSALVQWYLHIPTWKMEINVRKDKIMNFHGCNDDLFLFIWLKIWTRQDTEETLREGRNCIPAGLLSLYSIVISVPDPLPYHNVITIMGAQGDYIKTAF